MTTKQKNLTTSDTALGIRSGSNTCFLLSIISSTSDAHLFIIKTLGYIFSLILVMT